MIAGKKLLIFDFDGTIANTSPLHAKAFKDTLAPLEVPVCYSNIAGLRTADAMLNCFHQSGLTPPSSSQLSLLVSEKQHRVRKLIETSLQPIPQIDSFLRWSHTRYSLALVTSGSKATVSLALHKLDYQSLFQTQLYAEDVKSGKPDPEGFNLALKLESCKPAHALVFEDSKIGFQAATAADIEFVDVNHPSFGLIS